MYSTGFNSKCKSCVKEERESMPKVKYITRAELEEENKKLNEFKEKRRESMFYFKAQMERAEPKTAREAEDLQRAKELFEKLYREELSCLEEENKKLKEELSKYKKYYDRDKEELMESCYGLAKENDKLKSDLAEDDDLREELDYRKREDKELRKWIKEHVDYQTQADFRKRFEHK